METNSNRKYVIWLLILILLILGIFYHFKARNVIDNHDKIDTIETQIDSIKVINDTIYITIKETEEKIKVIKQKYEEDRNIVLHQSTDSDIVFFSKYLSENSE